MNNIDLTEYDESGVPISFLEEHEKALESGLLELSHSTTVNFVEGFSLLHYKDGTVQRFDHHPSTIATSDR